MKVSQDLAMNSKADARVQNLGTVSVENRRKMLDYIGRVGWGTPQCTWTNKIFDMLALYVGKFTKQTSHAELRKILVTTDMAQSAFIDWMQAEERVSVTPEEAVP
ncbi:unnamed protein product [Symbiodinium natans]|uniref:Uncharacterized protein n=1 Tax=Symbiodinium natans TaxID=878477 RepID=A0A812PX16_9DINO|nr:unnamed protein product [Symbiodinium natans]